jgi:hypothetical protein|tara:strand:+ start:8044 stop:8145 length:102 start_codon:yes stop_codon:yes gene_type:complete
MTFLEGYLIAFGMANYSLIVLVIAYVILKKQKK